VASALVEQEYDSDFEAKCREIDEFKKTRGYPCSLVCSADNWAVTSPGVSDQSDMPPAYVYVQPNNGAATNQSLGSKNGSLDE